MLNLVQGIKLDFTEQPTQQFVPSPYKLGAFHTRVTEEINRFHKMNIIEKCEHSKNEIISNIFCREKRSGGIRIIGDFKNINCKIKYQKFKQSSLKTTLDLIRPGDYMCSVDLTDAYYCVNVNPTHRKYLRFLWNGQLYQYVGMPQGISSSPRLFCKLIKIPISHLRKQNVNLDNFFDDLIIIASSKKQCYLDTMKTIKLLQELGYVINFSKSVLEPTQILDHLGVIINSINMTAKITPSKCDKIKSLCLKVLKNNNNTVRDLASLCGTMVSYIPGAEMGQLHYRHLELCKNRALWKNKGNYNGLAPLTGKAKLDIYWWLHNVDNQFTKLCHPKPSIFIVTDASQKMWGAKLLSLETGGVWDAFEQSQHINCLETKAILLGLKSLCKKVLNKHIRIKTDSKTALCYIKNKGGLVSYKCNLIAIKVWEWAVKHNCHITIEHVKSKDNEADFISRNQNNSSEWSLNPNTFQLILNFFKVQPSVDLFASRINNKLDRYFSHQLDPNAIGMDALLQDLDKEFFYAFPPINLITKFLKKVELEKLSGIIVLPCWSTQTFFPCLLNLLVDIPVLLKWNNDLLSHPLRGSHPLGKRLHLMACLISGQEWKKRAWINQLLTSCGKDYQNPHINNTVLTLGNGVITINNSIKIRMKRI